LRAVTAAHIARRLEVSMERQELNGGDGIFVATRVQRLSLLEKVHSKWDGKRYIKTWKTLQYLLLCQVTKLSYHYVPQ
jgi:hypothetical protein